MMGVRFCNMSGFGLLEAHGKVYGRMFVVSATAMGEERSRQWSRGDVRWRSGCRAPWSEWRCSYMAESVESSMQNDMDLDNRGTRVRAF